MMNETSRGTGNAARPEAGAAQHAMPPRLWPPLLLVGLFWTVYAVMRWTDLGAALGFMGFLLQLATSALVTVGFAAWWLASRRLRLADRFLVFGVAIVAGIGAVFLLDRSLRGFLLVPGVPLVLTAWTLALLVGRSRPPQTRRITLLAALVLTWGLFLLLRSEGVGGDFQPVLRWRWQASAEDRYLQELKGNQGTVTALPPAQPLILGESDWPGFRGPNRDGNRSGVRLAAHWDSVPPRLLWRRRIGPAWSSLAVVGDRLFTQEQVGDVEAVTCLDAATGRTIWSHQDAGRHEDGQGGPGPRATPTFADGRLFALGATGILNCLDAASGARQWSRDLAADAGAKKPMWGFASSPLISNGLVVVFAEGESEKTLLAYRIDSGQPAWAAAAGRTSYSSPQLARINGQAQILVVSDQGLTSVDPSSGTVLWEQRIPSGNPGIPQSVQPHVIGPTQVLFDAGPDAGTALVEVTHPNQSWVVTEGWLSSQLKPSFNDFVVHDNAIYGFDGRVFCCVDLQTGRRRWKEGRYGSGQVLLLGDQPLLLVLGESGEVVLVAANPDQHQVLGRFQAIEGKTWNHPVIANSRLFVRNAEEMACYDIGLERSDKLVN